MDVLLVAGPDPARQQYIRTRRAIGFAGLPVRERDLDALRRLSEQRPQRRLLHDDVARADHGEDALAATDESGQQAHHVLVADLVRPGGDPVEVAG
jgi:hypothetical protein